MELANRSCQDSGEEIYQNVTNDSGHDDNPMTTKILKLKVITCVLVCLLAVAMAAVVALTVINVITQSTCKYNLFLMHFQMSQTI